MDKKTIFGDRTKPKDIENHAKWEYNTFFLDTVIPALDYMIKEGNGYPQRIGSEKWNNILKNMKDGFELLENNMHRDGGWSFLQGFSKKDKAKIDRSFNLFKKHFFHLWD